MRPGKGFHGLPTHTISNHFLEVEFLSEAGPRVVGLYLAGTEENLLAEAPDVSWETPYGVYTLYGGHRLWHAPEAFPRTYVPDGVGLRVEEVDGGVRLVGQTEAATSLRKTIDVQLQPDRPALALRHILSNTGAWPVELAPWAITQLPLGGLAVLPAGAPELSPYLPNRHLAVWPYTPLDDPRLRFSGDLVLVEGAGRDHALKIGCLNHRGWLGYLRKGIFFIKRFQPEPSAVHPDLNCNAEVYVYDRFLELETVAPLCRLEPGHEVTHHETWELVRVPEAEATPEGLRSVLEALGLS
jgi:hypothetical protein